MVNAMPGMDQLPNQTAEPSADQLAAFEQMREQVSPTEINREMLMTAEQADPVAVAEFRKELAELEVAPEVIDMLNTMVDEVLANPNEYPAIRQKYLDMGVDEEILPEAFDAGLFAALNIALDELRGPENMLPPQGFAKGGIASLNPMAREMAGAGRYGDTMLAHISPVEAQILRRYGGSGTINPMTGMPEFFLKKTFKKLGKAVKKFASSSVGKIVTTMALAFFLGPAAAAAMGVSSVAGVAAVSGFVGSSGSTALAGGNLKESLRAGALGGITAGAGAGLMGGAQAFQAGSYTGPTTVGGQFDQARSFLTGAPAEAAAETAKLPNIGTAPATDTGVRTFGLGEQTPITRTPMGIEGLTVDMGPNAAPFSAQVAPFQAPIRPSVSPIAAAQRSTPASNLPGTGVLKPEFMGSNTSSVTAQNMAGGAQGNAPRSIVQQGLDRILPNRIEAEAQRGAFQKVADQFGGTAEQIQAALSAPNPSPALVEAYKKAATPGMLRQFGPLAATGLGIMALGGGFKEEETAPPEGFEDFMSGPGQRLLDQDPAKYGLSYGGVNTTATTSMFNPYSYTPPAPRAAAKGGSMTKKFPRKTGPINGPGTGTSDDIPAMLSDGEFVFTAKAVRGMGNGSRRAGAKKMYALMRKLEGRKNG